MNGNDLDHRLKRHAEEAVRAEGCELLELNLKRDGARATLELIVDRNGELTVEDCARVSRRLAPVLEGASDLKDKFVLEVSSPGLTRKLNRPEDYRTYAGRLALIEMNQATEEMTRFRGRLLGVGDGDTVHIHDQTLDRDVALQRLGDLIQD